MPNEYARHKMAPASSAVNKSRRRPPRAFGRLGREQGQEQQTGQADGAEEKFLDGQAADAEEPEKDDKCRREEQ